MCEYVRMLLPQVAYTYGGLKRGLRHGFRLPGETTQRIPRGRRTAWSDRGSTRRPGPTRHAVPASSPEMMRAAGRRAGRRSSLLLGLVREHRRRVVIRREVD